MKGRTLAVLLAAAALVRSAGAGEDYSEGSLAPRPAIGIAKLDVVPLRAEGLAPAAALTLAPAAPRQAALPLSLVGVPLEPPRPSELAVGDPSLALGPEPAAPPRSSQDRAILRARLDARRLVSGFATPQEESGEPGADFYDARQWSADLIPDREYADRLAAAAALLAPADRARSAREQAPLRAHDALVATMKAKDGKVYAHLLRVGLLSGLIAWKMGLPLDAALRTMRAGRLHDIGKREDAILAVINKPGRLTRQEHAIMEGHTATGAAIISSAPGLDDENRRIGMAVALTHHETPDGKGYPLTALARGVPLESRIVQLADRFDALLENRPYKAGMTVKEALEIMESAKADFDPAAWAAFEALIRGPLADAASRPRVH